MLYSKIIVKIINLVDELHNFPLAFILIVQSQTLNNLKTNGNIFVALILFECTHICITNIKLVYIQTIFIARTCLVIWF